MLAIALRRESQVAARCAPSLAYKTIAIWELVMPTYDYRCRSCQAEFSRIERIADHGPGTPSCPKCGSPDVERVISAAYARTARKS
jgi:putative FmdB family regulatory protein